MPEKDLSIPAARSEARDVGGWFIAGAFTLLVTSVGLVGLISWFLFPHAPHAALIPYPVPAYPPPQLQASPHEDMVRFYRQEMARLNSVGWIDRQRQIVHMPIDDAMRAVAARGIPGWPETVTTPAGAASVPAIKPTP